MGEPTVSTSDRSLTKRELTILFLRLMAIWFILRSAIDLASVLLMIPLDAASSAFNEEWSVYLSWIVLTVPRLLVGIGLWWSVPRLSELLLAHDGPVFGSAELTRDSLSQLGAMLMGLYFVAVSIPAIASALKYGGPFVGTDPLKWFGPVMQLIMGLALVLGRNAIARLIAWARIAGTSKSAA